VPNQSAPVAHAYRELSALRLWRHGSRQQKIGIFGLWLVSLLLCLALGLATVIREWSGIPFSLGGVTVYLTFYPPLPICLLLVLTMGWWWGAIPAFLSTLALALYAGMPLAWALIFSFVDPLGFAVVVIGYQAFSTRRDLRSVIGLLFYTQLSFVSCIFSSSGALIWSYTNHLQPGAQLPIWQGWWLGSFLQCVILVAPPIMLLWPWVERWQQAHPNLLCQRGTGTRRAVIRLLTSATFGVLVYGFITLRLAEAQAVASQRLDVLQQATWILYWVFAIIVLFIALFGYELFVHWQTSTDGLLAELQHANEDLVRLATTDSLTCLWNRRAADDKLEAEWQRAKRTLQPASLVMLDIDHFKQVNDMHGHPAGDAALRLFAATIKSTIREIDTAARYGGEEFLILLPNTGAQGAYVFAERLRERIAASPVCHEGRQIHCRTSVGVAVSTPDEAGCGAWMQRADQALYLAKQGGRNRTVMLS
jgi:diguanylate cyclase